MMHWTSPPAPQQWPYSADIWWILKRVRYILLQCFLVFPAEITEEETNATPGDQEEQSEAKDTKDQSYGKSIFVAVGEDPGSSCGVFTLPDTETDTETDKKWNV